MVNLKSDKFSKCWIFFYVVMLTSLDIVFGGFWFVIVKMLKHLSKFCYVVDSGLYFQDIRTLMDTRACSL